MAKLKIAQTGFYLFIILFCGGWLSASDSVVKVTNLTRSIKIIKSSVDEPQDGLGSRDVTLTLQNIGTSPLLAITYERNRDKNRAEHGAGTEVTQSSSFLQKQRIKPGGMFEEKITGDLETIQVTVSCAVFQNGKDEGDPYMAEDMRAGLAGQAARAKQILSLLKTITTLANLEAGIRSLQKPAPSMKFSARARQSFDIGIKTENDSIGFTIEELKQRKTEQIQPDDFQYERQVAEVLQ